MRQKRLMDRPQIYEWNEAKRAANLDKHGIDFADAEKFGWAEARVYLDARRDYGETRFQAFARLGEVACVMVFTRRGGRLRVIGMRRANERESTRHGL